MMTEEKILLFLYNKGWNDCSSKTNNAKRYKDLERTAYELGQTHYKMGDDVKSIDELSNNEIIKMIYGTDRK